MRLIKEFISKNKKLLLFHLLVNVLIGVFISASSYVHIPITNASGFISYLIHFCLLQFTLFGFTYLISLNTWVFRILFSIFFLVFSFVGFWGYSQDVVITDGVIQATLETKAYIVVELINIYLILYVLLSIAVLYWILKRYNQLERRFAPVILSIALIAVFAYFMTNSLRSKTLSSRLPYSIASGMVDYYQKPTVKFKEVDSRVQAKHNDINIVFVLGESVRADHLGINGYARNTTPRLEQIEDLISFKNLNTDRLFTAVSIPQILSDEPMDNPKIEEKTSLVDVLNKVDYTTYWIGNQVSEVSYAYFIRKSKEQIMIDPFHSVFSYNNASDLELLPYFQKTLSNPSPNFILLHMLGSHWMYSKRYEDGFRIFTPTAESKYLPANTKEEMINAYDNTILLLDHFMAEVIEDIKKKDDKTILVYLADHGELLGENGHYLHAVPGEPIKNPAGMIWLSPKLKEAYPEYFHNIRQKKDDTIQLDFFFPTILDLIGVEGMEYDKNKSVIRP